MMDQSLRGKVKTQAQVSLLFIKFTVGQYCSRFTTGDSGPRGFSLVLPRLSRPGDELQDLPGCGAPSSCPARPPCSSAPGWAARVCLGGRSGHFQQEIVAPVITAADSLHTSLHTSVPWDLHQSWKLAPCSLPFARWVNGGR